MATLSRPFAANVCIMPLDVGSSGGRERREPCLLIRVSSAEEVFEKISVCVAK